MRWRSAVALGHLSFQIRQFASHHDVFGRESGTDPTALALFEPSRDAADNHARDENRKSHKIERNRHGKVRIGRIERVEGHGDRLVMAIANATSAAKAGTMRIAFRNLRTIGFVRTITLPELPYAAGSGARAFPCRS